MFKQLLRAFKLSSFQERVHDLVAHFGKVLDEGTCGVDVSHGQHRQRQLIGIFQRSSAPGHFVAAQEQSCDYGAIKC
ncbi:hypothetical protein D3C73_1369100 [compost metagenome]